LAGGLAGCGRQAELDRPLPRLGQTKGPSAEQVTRDQAAARARREGAANADPRAPESVDEVRNQPLPAPPPSPPAPQ
jgi:hypothetical protein